MNARIWMVCTTCAAGLMLSACSGMASRPGGDGFPDPGSAILKGGHHAELDEVRLVHAGLSKDQLYPLLGPPHFDEGVFHVRVWNYLLNLPDARASNGRLQCQLRLRFNDNQRVTEMAWKPQACVALLHPAPPRPGAVSIESIPHKSVRLAGNTLFEFDSAALSASGRRAMSSLVERAQAAGPLGDVAIVGFTDTIGGARYNRKLSLQRAQAVRDYLAAHGVPPQVIRVQGRGESDPVVQCPGLQGRALVQCLQPNRRVEVSGLTQP